MMVDEGARTERRMYIPVGGPNSTTNISFSTDDFVIGPEEDGCWNHSCTDASPIVNLQGGSPGPAPIVVPPTVDENVSQEPNIPSETLLNSQPHFSQALYDQLVIYTWDAVSEAGSEDAFKAAMFLAIDFHNVVFENSDVNMRSVAQSP